MRPILFHIGSFPVHSFGVMMMIAFFAGLWVMRSRAIKFGFDPNQVADISFYTLIAGVLGARLVFILQELPEYLKHPDQLFTLQFQGLTSFGGLFFGMAVLIGWAVAKKHSVARLLDLAAPAFLLGHAIGRIGCFLNGCCFGGVCAQNFPLGIHVEGSPLLHHPAQLYDTAMNLVGFGVLMLFERRSRVPGLETGLALILHGTARFIYEFWRAGESSTYWGSLPITQAQAMAIGLVAGGIGLVCYSTMSRRREARTA